MSKGICLPILNTYDIMKYRLYRTSHSGGLGRNQMRVEPNSTYCKQVNHIYGFELNIAIY